MVDNPLPKVLRGYDMVAVDNLVEELKSEIAEIGKSLGKPQTQTRNSGSAWGVR